MAEVASHKIYMNGRWEIRDLYSFPHRYEEVYSFLYALAATSAPQQDLFAELFHRYPWRGGYSAVNFYDAKDNDGRVLRIDLVVGQRWQPERKGRNRPLRIDVGRNRGRESPIDRS